MGEGYGFSAHTQLQPSTSDKEAFLYIRLRMTPPIFNRQVTKEKGLTCTVHNSWVTMHAVHVK